MFQVDPDEVKYQADDYNRKLGLGKSRSSSRSSRRAGAASASANGRGPDRGVGGQRESSSSKRRDGFAYRYVTDEDDEYDEYDDNFYNDGDDNFDEEINVNQSQSKKQQKKSTKDIDVIDVEATETVESVKKKKEEEDEDRPNKRQQSWEDRAFAYELIPPKGIKAWGPQGDVDNGIDVRTHAARLAKEEIQMAREVFERKEEAVVNAEKDLIEVKQRATSLKKKILLQDDRRRIDVIRDELRMVNFDIEEEARNLRRAKGEALAAIDKLEAIELRHWALLRQNEADLELLVEDASEGDDDVGGNHDEETTSSNTSTNASSSSLKRDK